MNTSRKVAMQITTPRGSIALLSLLCFAYYTDTASVKAFQLRPPQPCLTPPVRQATTSLDMAKGLNKLRSKQAALQQKLQEAKRQNQAEDEDDASVNGKLSDEEIRERNDRLRFEQLLSAGSIPKTDRKDTSYLNIAQEDAEIDAASKLLLIVVAAGS